MRMQETFFTFFEEGLKVKSEPLLCKERQGFALHCCRALCQGPHAAGEVGESLSRPTFQNTVTAEEKRYGLHHRLTIPSMILQWRNV